MSADTAVVVRDAGPGTFQTEVVAGSHRFLADEPGAPGGTNTGPSPYDLLQIADMCPVHRTLHSEIQAVTTLRD